MTADLSMPRETGAEQAAEPCPECGGPRQLIESGYGSVSPSACPNCWPAAPSDDPLAAQKAAAEKAAADEAAAAAAAKAAADAAGSSSTGEGAPPA